MSTRPAPQVFLKDGANPWSERLDDGVVLQILVTAAVNAELMIQSWIELGKVEDGEDAAYALVILDPTRPRGQITIEDRIMAHILFGDPEMAKGYLPNAAAKADATDRHGVPNGELVKNASYALGNGDFAWGDAAVYSRIPSTGSGQAIAAGSGLSVSQDHRVAFEVVKPLVDRVHAATKLWLQERRKNGGSQAWLNQANQSGWDYPLRLEAYTWRSPSLDS